MDLLELANEMSEKFTNQKNKLKQLYKDDTEKILLELNDYNQTLNMTYSKQCPEHLLVIKLLCQKMSAYIIEALINFKQGKKINLV